MKTMIALLLAIFLMALPSELLAEHSNESRHKEIVCLATTIYYEARGESLNGQIAVAQAVIHRVKHSAYPESICRVVKQRGQFPWYRPGTMVERDSQLFLDIRRLAEMLYWEFYLSDNYPDLVDGATHFHTPAVNPRWRGKTFVRQIGDHLFFRVRE